MELLKMSGQINIYDIFIADTFFRRLIGYMFRKKPHHNAILFYPCNSIHTYFMKFKIDVLFLDKQYKVIRKVEGLEVRKFIMPIKNANYVIEAKDGFFKDIQEGDRVCPIQY